MDYLTPLGIVALAGLTHASFQLGVSMMTLLSGHSLSAKRSGERTLGLVASFYCGAFVMSTFIVSFIAYVVTRLWSSEPSIWIWTTTSSLLIGLGLIVWITYYRPKGQGTQLWIPRGIAAFLSNRTKATRSGVEAFSLGLVSVLGELIFVAPPALAASLAISTLPPVWQLAGLLGYALIASLGLGIVVVLIGSGRRISTIQRWRETHKKFLQYVAGAGLIILGFFIYATYVAAPIAQMGGL